MNKKSILITSMTAFGCFGITLAQGPHDRKRWYGEDGHKRDLIEKFDKDGDGELSEEERNAARKAGAKGKRGEKHYKMHEKGGEQWKKKLLEKFDEDGDGELSEEERDVARRFREKQIDAVRHGEEAIKKKFLENYDTDGDGKISEQERSVAKIEMKQKWEQKKAEMLKLYDADGDGELSKDEHEVAGKAQKQKMLDQFDTDEDGKLSEEERKIAFKELLENDPAELMLLLKNKKDCGRPPHPHRGEGGPHRRPLMGPASKRFGLQGE